MRCKLACNHIPNDGAHTYTYDPKGRKATPKLSALEAATSLATIVVRIKTLSYLPASHDNIDVVARSNNQQYLQTHRQLRAIWLEDVARFANLTSREQWVLHDFFKPATDLSDEALLDHRQRVTQERPSLPQQAGRALSKLREGHVPVPVGQVVTSSTKRGKVRHVSVRSVVNPEPDLHKLAKALLAMAIQQAEEESAARKADGRPHGDTRSGEDVLDGGLGEVELGGDLTDGKP